MIAACPANPTASDGHRRAALLPLVLNSSCWLEHFADSDRAALYEVEKELSRKLGDEVASQALSLMHQGQVV